MHLPSLPGFGAIVRLLTSGRGQFIGLIKIDIRGNLIPISADQDVRPSAMEVMWGKVAFVLFPDLDVQNIRSRRMPTQLAVRISCGGKVMAHAARHWL